MMDAQAYRKFYEEIDREERYASQKAPEEHASYQKLINFINEFGLLDKKCLEIGSSVGIFQDMVADYTGLDIAASLSKYYRKPYLIVNEDGSYPFPDHTFDGIWAITVHEHIPNLNQALFELTRVLKVGGVVFFEPAWQCRPWAAEGLAVRPYRELGIWDRLLKALIPLRDSVLWRSLFIFPKRLYRHLLFLLGGKVGQLPYKKLRPNYGHFWTSDSDACNSIDPHDAILWFVSNGFLCLSHPLHLRTFLVRTGPLMFQKNWS